MRLSILVLLLLSLASFLTSQDKPAARIHGYVFGDYFYKIRGNDQEVSALQYSKVPADYQAFQFRRLHLYVDHEIANRFSAQLLLEGNDKTFEAGGRHTMFIKAAYLEWREIFPMSNLAFGLVPTPTWSWAGSEMIWGYRSIEKTISDMRGFGSASDIGVALRGSFDAGQVFSYVTMVGNGTGQRPEINKYKKYYGAFIVKPVKGLVLDAYADYEPAAFQKSKLTLKGFVGFQTEQFAVGGEYVQQTQRKAGVGGRDIIPAGASLFAWLSVAKPVILFARYDYSDPDRKIAGAGYKEHFAVAGLDFMPVSNVHIMPNVWFNTFDPKGRSPKKDADVVARITVFFVYK
ncbi:MAG: hypothetical protein FJ215_00335 [Ignavibacteria bacterium]|nr:hypothetical protein [Ignavibacteria bacterium]